MINYIWGFLMLASLIVATVNGKLEIVVTAAMTGASEGIGILITLLGITCLWTGIMKIAKSSGIIDLVSIIIRPIIKLLFPRLPKNSPATDAIIMNIVANMLGMSNAATPLGIKAMRELEKINSNNYRIASHEMCLFVILNTSCLQIIPSTLISLRKAYHSSHPFSVIILSWICSICSIVVGIISAKIFGTLEEKKFNSPKYKRLQGFKI